MRAEDFRAFVEQLNDLSEVQRAALVAALAGKSAASEAVALIETRFAAAPCCGHCKSERFGPWGHASGLKRYKCKDCGRTFNALTGTPLAQLHRRDAWLDYARALTRDPGAMLPASIERLRTAGWSDGEILEINQVTAYFAYANRTVLGLGCTTEGEVLGLSPGNSDDPNDWNHR